MSKRGYRTYMFVSNCDILPTHLWIPTALETTLADQLPHGTQWAYIVHDKDVYTVEDQQLNPQHVAGSPKAKHLHISMYLPNAKTIPALAKCLGVPPQYIQKFTGDNAKQNLFSYLIHRTEGSKRDGKHVYSFDEVHANFDYKAYVEGITNAIKSAELDKDTVQQLIMTNKLRFIDFITNDKYTGFYIKNKQFVTTCIDTFYKRQMNNRSRDKITVLYIEGESGSGKTEYAKHYALKNYRDYCMSSSANDSAQDYLGQDVMIFDDARPSDFTAAEWLKLLDPYNNESTINSRYYNKYLAVKCIILTSVVPFLDFFAYAFQNGGGNQSEPIAQFIRRFDYVLQAKLNQHANIISTDISIHRIMPNSNGYIRDVGKHRIMYYHYINDQPECVVNQFIAQINPTGSSTLLNTF